MGCAPVVLALQLITITSVDGKVIELNRDRIVAFRMPRASDPVAQGAKCLIFTSDGRFINSAQTCNEIRKMLEQP